MEHRTEFLCSIEHTNKTNGGEYMESWSGVWHKPLKQFVAAFVWKRSARNWIEQQQYPFDFEVREFTAQESKSFYISPAVDGY